MASRAVWRPGCRCCASAARRGRGRPARRCAAAPSTSARSRRRSSAPMQLADQLEQPLILEPPSRPLPGRTLLVRGRRHAQSPADRLRPRSARAARRRTRSPRTVWIELAREKHRRRFQDLVRTTRLEHLTTRLADLLRLGAGRRVRDGGLHSLRPSGRTCAASLTANPDQQRRVRLDVPTRTPAAVARSNSSPDTSSLSARQISPSARRTLASKSPSNPGWLSRVRETILDRRDERVAARQSELRVTVKRHPGPQSRAPPNCCRRGSQTNCRATR